VAKSLSILMSKMSSASFSRLLIFTSDSVIRRMFFISRNSPVARIAPISTGARSWSVWSLPTSSGTTVPTARERTGATINLIPCLLGGIFKATNNASPMVAFGGVKGKLAYEGLETRRYVAKHGIGRFRQNGRPSSTS